LVAIDFAYHVFVTAGGYNAKAGASRFNDHPRRYQLKYFAIFSSEESKRSPRITLLLSSLTSAYFPRLSLLIEGD